MEPYEQRYMDWMAYTHKQRLGPDGVYQRDPDHNRAGYLTVLALAFLGLGWAFYANWGGPPPIHVPGVPGKVCTCPCSDEPSTRIRGLDPSFEQTSPDPLHIAPLSPRWWGREHRLVQDIYPPPIVPGAPSK